MPKFTVEHYGSGDMSWLGSAHGLGNARTVLVDASKFTEADHYPNGHIRSGQPITVDESGIAGPYTGAEGQTFDGFILTDQATDGKLTFAAPLLDHGRVKVDRLPVSFTKPESTTDQTTFVYV